MDFTVRLEGTRPLLMHNGRLANPLDPWSQRVKAVSNKKNKTDADLLQLCLLEARAGLWETSRDYNQPKSTVGLPNAAVWRCIYDAAKAFKLGEDIKRSLRYEDIVAPLLVDGEELNCDEYASDLANIYYVPVRLMGKKTMRARCRIPDWTSEHRFSLDEDVLDLRRLIPVMERAGSMVGVGDWRPTYGTFVATFE